MKRALIVAVAALVVVPSVALAKGPPSGKGSGTHGKAKVMYVLKGMIYAYTAYNSATNTPGSITIDVNHANRHGKLLVGQTGITVPVGPNTKVVLANGVTSIASSQPGDRGIVKIRAARLAFKGATLADVQNALMNQPASQVIDQGAASSS